MSKPTAISRISNDNKYTFTTTILTDETIAAGAGTVSFERLNLTAAQFEALSLAETQRQFYEINKDLLDQRNQITNIITVEDDDMPAGSIVEVTLYTRNLGVSKPFKVISSTLPGIGDGEFEVNIIDNSELSFADWFTIKYTFAQGSEYAVTVDLAVTNKPAVLATDGGPGDGIPEVDSSSAIAAAKYASPVDFAAAYASSTTIDITSLPAGFSITDASQIQYVKQVNAANTLGVYQQAVNDVSFTYAAGTLTIVGAGTPFAAGDVYEVGINEQDKGYTEASKSFGVNEISPGWSRNTDIDTIATAYNFTASMANVGSEIDVRQHNVLTLWITITIGTSTNPQIRYLAKHTSGGGEEYPGIYLEAPASNITNVEPNVYQLPSANGLTPLRIDVSGYQFIQIQAKDDAGGTGVINALYASLDWKG